MIIPYSHFFYKPGRAPGGIFRYSLDIGKVLPHLILFL